MRDRTVGETFFMFFTTRAFATGVPTALAGTPVVSAYEDNSITQITAGITLGVDHDGVVGLNLLTLVATGANGFDAGKDYSMVITTGTVGGVSVIGEVVGEFSLGLGAGFTRLGAPAGASVSVDIVDLPTVSEFNARTLVAASYFDPTADAVANVTLVATTTTNTDMRGTDAGLTVLASGTAQGGSASTIQLASGETFADSEPNSNIIKITSGTGAGQSRLILSYVGATDTATVTPDWITAPDATSVYEMVQGAANVEMWNALAVTTNLETAADVADAVWDEAQADHVAAGSFGIMASEIAAIPTTAMRGTDSAALASVCTEARLTELDAVNLPTTTDDILTDTAEIGTAGAGLTAIMTTQMTESFAADGVAPTPAQALFMLQQILGDFAISGTTLTVRKIDGATTAATYTLDSATTPTSITRTT